MANKTISQLSAVTTAADGDLLIIEQGGTTYKITKASLFAAITNALNAEIASTNADIASIESNFIKKDGSVALSGALSMGSNKLTNVTDCTANQDAATKAYVDGRKVHDLTAPSAAFSMNSQKITNLAAPASSNDATRKTYVDTLIENCLRWDGTKTLDCSSGPAVPALAVGEVRRVSVAGKFGANSGTEGTHYVTVEVGDLILCHTATAGGAYTDEGADVMILQTNTIGDASATVKGKVELSTDAELITGTDTGKAVTPANIENKLAKRYWQRTAVSGATKTLDEDEYGVIGVTRTSSGTCTITLPQISSLTTAGKEKAKARYIIVDEAGNASTNNITISKGGSDTINGASNFVINKNHGSVELYNNESTGWFTTTFMDVDTDTTDRGVVYQANISLTSSEIQALGTGKEFVEAPGASRHIIPLSCFAVATAGDTAYATNTTLQLTYGNTDAKVAMNWHASLLTASEGTSIKQATIVQGTGTSGGTSDIAANTALHVKVNNGNPASGNGTVKVYLTYIIQ